MKKLITCTVLLTLFFSCSDECITCTVEAPFGPIDQEYCDDETNYTDQNGEIISFCEFISQLESSGNICK